MDVARSWLCSFYLLPFKKVHSMTDFKQVHSRVDRRLPLAVRNSLVFAAIRGSASIKLASLLSRFQVPLIVPAMRRECTI